MFREAYETFREAFCEAFRECLQVLRIVRHDSTNGLLNVLESRAIHPYVVRCGYQLTLQYLRSVRVMQICIRQLSCVNYSVRGRLQRSMLLRAALLSCVLPDCSSPESETTS